MLRTSCNANPGFNTKFISEFEVSLNERSRISPAPRPVAKSLLKEVPATTFKSPKIVFTYGNKPTERGRVQ